MNTSKLRAAWDDRQAHLGRLRSQWQSEEVVFGKPEWFAKRQTGWGITPSRLPGWIYGVVWSLVIAIPFLTLIIRHRSPEAAVWLAGSIGMLTWDVRKLMRALDTPRSWSLRRNVASEHLS